MLTANDIKIMKEIFVTKEELNTGLHNLKNELRAEIQTVHDKLENLIVTEVKNLIDMIGEIIETNKELASEIRMNSILVSDHEHRLKNLEKKVYK